MTAQFAEPFPKVTELLAGARENILAFTNHLRSHWKQIWSNNSKRGKTKRSAAGQTWWGFFLTGPAIIRLVEAVLAQQHDEWTISRHYLSMSAANAP